MRLAILILISLFVASQALTRVNLLQIQKKIDNVKKTNSWGKITLTLAELHMLSDSPLNDLIDALSQLVLDLEVKSQNEQDEWAALEGGHNGLVRQLQGDIASASEDVFDAQQTLDNDLYPRRGQLEQQVQQLKDKIQWNNDRIEQLHSQREQDHNGWLERVEEHQNTLAALREALDLLSQLLQQNVSLVQVRSAKQHLSNISKRLGKSSYSTLAKTLVSLATGEFADTRLVQDVISKLSGINVNIQNSLLQENQNEQRQVQEHDEEVARLEQNNVENNIHLHEAENELDATNYSISEQEAFKAQRQSDWDDFQNMLDEENRQFQQSKEFHEDLAAQLAAEVNAAQEAFNIVSDGDFSDYIKQRLGGL